MNEKLVDDNGPFYPGSRSYFSHDCSYTFLKSQYYFRNTKMYFKTFQTQFINESYSKFCQKLI